MEPVIMEKIEDICLFMSRFLCLHLLICCGNKQLSYNLAFSTFPYDLEQVNTFMVVKLNTRILNVVSVIPIILSQPVVFNFLNMFFPMNFFYNYSTYPR